MRPGARWGERPAAEAVGRGVVVVLNGDARSRTSLGKVLAESGLQLVEAARPEAVGSLARARGAGLALVDLALDALEPIPPAGAAVAGSRLGPASLRAQGYALLREERRTGGAGSLPAVRLRGDESQTRHLIVGLVPKPIDEGRLRQALLCATRAASPRQTDEPGVWRPAAMVGSLDLLSAPSVLRMCHSSGVSGRLNVTEGRHWARVDFQRGEMWAAHVDGQSGVAAVGSFLEWRTGRFEFVLGRSQVDRALFQPFEVLLLEACRLLDEQRERRAHH